jgi:branched-chain amino acid transport system substrate-binding protein
MLALCAVAGPARAEPTGPVKIGVLTDMSGVYGDTAGEGSRLAAQMAIEEVGGTALGQPIELVAADHQNKADLASSIARQWYDADHVDMITDLTNSAAALAVSAVTKEKDKIDIVSGGSSSEISNGSCTTNNIHWTQDTYALSAGSATALYQQGGKSWFFLTADYGFGHQLEQDAAKTVERLGGKVLGEARHPLSAADFSSYLLQAQGSGAEVVGLADAGKDATTAIKQAAEFGLTPKQKLVGLLTFITDIDALGLATAKGLNLTTPFYWDMNDETRAFGKRFFARHHKMPTMTQAGVYTATLFYLKAVKAVGSKDTASLLRYMHDTPINDMMTKDGRIRADGRVERDFYLMEVKAPAESRYPWDYYKLIATIPRDKAIRPAADSQCPLLKKS